MPIKRSTQTVFIARVQYLINRNHSSVTDVAKHLGISRNSVYTWLNGSRLPSLYVIYDLAGYFKVSIDYLLGRDDYLPETYASLLHPNTLDLNMINEAALKIIALIDKAKVK